MLELAKWGVQAVRINCAYDDADAWGRMIGDLRAAEAATDRDLKVLWIWPVRRSAPATSGCRTTARRLTAATSSRSLG
jgi:hypothetical protein